MDTDSFEHYLEESERGPFRKAAVLTIAVSSTAVITLTAFQSMTEIASTFNFWSSLLVWLGVVSVHLVTLLAVSNAPLWRIAPNKVRFFVGSCLTSFCCVLLCFVKVLTHDWGAWTLAAIRLLTEVGFALVLHSLPAILCTELPSSARVLTPIYHAVHLAMLFPMTGLNAGLVQLHGAVPPILTTAVSVVAATAYCGLLDTHWDSYRRANPRVRTISRSWDIVLVASISFVASFSVVFVSTAIQTLPEINDTFLGYVGLTSVTAAICLASALVVGLTVRWLPPRGLLFCGALLTSLGGLVLLEVHLHRPHQLIPLLALVLLAAGVGTLPVLMQSHLLDRLTQRFYNRHLVASSRVVSGAAWLGALAASTAPVFLAEWASGPDKVSGMEKCLLLPITLTVLASIAVAGTVIVEFRREARQTPGLTS